MSDAPVEQLVQSKSPQVVRGMFTDISSTYDALNHILSLNIDKRWRRFTAAQTIKDHRVSRILDVCGGTGDLTLALHRQASRLQIKPLLICSDFTPSMTRIAQRKFDPQIDSQTAVPMVADTTCLPFQDNSFDLVTVAFGIRNVVDTQLGLDEMARVCRPGGCVAVLEFSNTRSPLINSAFSFYFRSVLPLIGRAVTGTSAYSYLSKSVEAFPEGSAFCKLLSNATGSPSTATPLSFGIATLYMSQKA